MQSRVELCNRCGSPESVLFDESELVTIRLTDVRLLTDLLRGELDQAACRACQAKLPVAPTVAVVDDDAETVDWVAGTVLGTARDLPAAAKSRLFEGRAADRVALRRVDGMDMLRDEVRRRLLREVAPIADLYYSSVAHTAMILERHWRSLTVRAFTAAQVAVDARLGFPRPQQRPPWQGPGFGGISAEDAMREMFLTAAGGKYRQARTDDPLDDPDDTLGWLGSIQVRVWRRLLEARLSQGEPGSFEEDLHQHVDGLSGQLAEGMHRAFSAMEAPSEDDSAVVMYLKLALEASIAAAVNMPGSQPVIWAFAYFRFETTIRQHPEVRSPFVESLRLSPSRAAASITYETAWAALSMLVPVLIAVTDEPGWAEIRPDADKIVAYIEAVATAVGFPGMTTNVLYDHLGMDGDRQVILADLVSALGEIQPGTDIDEVLAALRLDAIALARSGRVADLLVLGDAVADHFGRSPLVHAATDAWLGEWLALAGRPDLLIARIGVQPRDWEAGLAPLRQARLAVRRASGLDDLGREVDAAELLAQAVPVLQAEGDPGEAPVAKVHLARSYASIGRPDAALAELDILLADELLRLDPDLLVEMTVVYAALSQPNQAIAAIDRAIAMMTVPRKLTQFRLIRAQQLTVARRNEEALQQLLDVDRADSPGSAAALFAEAHAWGNLLHHMKSELPAPARERISRVLADLSSTAQDRQAAGRLTDYATCVSAIGHIKRGLPDEDSELATREELATLEQNDLPVPAELLIDAASYAYDHGDTDLARRRLGEVPAAIARRYGKVSDLAMIVGAASDSTRALAKLAYKVVTRHNDGDADVGWQDLRLIADLQRDPLGRARRISSGISVDEPQGYLSDEHLMSVAHGKPLAILEWINMEPPGSQHFTAFAFLTRVHHSHISTTRPPLGADLITLERRLHARLMNWLPDTEDGPAPGDPFDLPAWQQMVTDLARHLNEVLDADDHVIAIPFGPISRLPWHVAVGSRFTCSYASSWSTLLEITAKPVRRDIETATVVCVPRYHESQRLTLALEASTDRSVTRLRDTGVDVTPLIGIEADPDTVQQRLAGVDLAKILCHGYLEQATQTVGILVAYDGQLPLADSSASPAAMSKHLVSWRDMQAWSNSPRVLFLAACSSAHTHVAGLSQPLSLFTALRHNGTGAIIAPRWDFPIGATSVLDEALDNFLAGMPLASALRLAAVNAMASGMPQWQAWALCLEGDWR